MLFILIYFLGAFVTKVIITIHDNKARLQYRVDDCDTEMMAMWFIALPLMLIAALFYLFYTAAQNLGDWICETIRRKKNG